MATAPTASETAELLFGCFKRMRRLVDTELSECGLSISRTKLLSELHQSGPQNQAALAGTFGLAPRTVTELVDTLERDGLVERHTDPADRRARQVHLTQAGEAARIQGMAVRDQLITRVLGTLDEPRLAELHDTLHRIELQLDRIDAEDGAAGSVAGLPPAL